MEESKNIGLYNVQQEQEEKSSFDFKTLYTVFLLNWKWFVLSIIICVAAAPVVVVIVHYEELGISLIFRRCVS